MLSWKLRGASKDCKVANYLHRVTFWKKASCQLCNIVEEYGGTQVVEGKYTEGTPVSITDSLHKPI